MKLSPLPLTLPLFPSHVPSVSRNNLPVSLQSWDQFPEYTHEHLQKHPNPMIFRIFLPCEFADGNPDW